MIAFDNTVSMGHIIQLAAILIGGFFFIWEMRTKLLMLADQQITFSSRLEKIDNEIVVITKFSIEIARQQERMLSQDHRIQELSNRLENYCRKGELKAESVTTKRKR